MWLAFLLAVSLPALDNHGAELLFQKMEAALDKAKTLDLSFETIYGEGSLRNGQRLKGTLIAMSGNKLRLEVKGGKANDTLHLRVADGTRGILIVERDDGSSARPTNVDRKIVVNAPSPARPSIPLRPTPIMNFEFKPTTDYALPPPLLFDGEVAMVDARIRPNSPEGRMRESLVLDRVVADMDVSGRLVNLHLSAHLGTRLGAIRR